MTSWCHGMRTQWFPLLHQDTDILLCSKILSSLSWLTRICPCLPSSVWQRLDEVCVFSTPGFNYPVLKHRFFFLQLKVTLHHLLVKEIIAWHLFFSLPEPDCSSYYILQNCSRSARRKLIFNMAFCCFNRHT